jgi:hypothetical protein
MKCIACKSAEAESEEHIFPGSIGGSFTLKCLCHSCNNGFGSDVDSKLLEHLHIYEAYQCVQSELPKPKQFKFKESNMEFEDGYVTKATKNNLDKKALWTEIAPKLYRTNMEDIGSVLTKFEREATKFCFSTQDIAFGKEKLRAFHSTAQKGESIELGPFKLEIINLEATRNSVLSTEYPYRFACKVCLELAHYFGITDEIKNLEEICRYAKEGQTGAVLRFKYGRYPADHSTPEHSGYFGVQYFATHLFFSVFVLVEIEWKSDPRYFGYIENIASKEVKAGPIDMTTDTPEGELKNGI